ncbi:hypothetical protein [Rhizobium sp. NZLR1]|uniref:hypothetical protein n=1 Tax=Rhizobium sp. NZLR1 TaxID=2731096 RepID=UPI001A9A0247|nr:hypothetical protein [Rhizobium sp. NZLR1]MBX5202238.1 hypothetical protein [Rhizobium sp. NZLR1]QSZ20848.1 hypothetical protein J3O30_21575 [Rhizobium sp. NZLR1]
MSKNRKATINPVAPPSGLTKREFFAAQVLGGLVSNGLPPKILFETRHNDLALQAIQYADALVAWLELDAPEIREYVHALQRL